MNIIAIPLPIIGNHPPTDYNLLNFLDDLPTYAIVSFLVTIINHKIWKCRSNKIYENQVIGPFYMIDEIESGFVEGAQENVKDLESPISFFFKTKQNVVVFSKIKTKLQVISLSRLIVNQPNDFSFYTQNSL